GAGIEFFGIRGYQPGDRLRDLNWAVTSRLGQPHVNQRAALRAADLVIMIDAFSDVGPPGDTSLDLAVRGAAGLATAYLRTGDRPAATRRVPGDRGCAHPRTTGCAAAAHVTARGPALAPRPGGAAVQPRQPRGAGAELGQRNRTRSRAGASWAGRRGRG